MGNCYCRNISNNVNINNLKKTNFNTPEYSLNNIKMYGKPVYVYDGDTLHIVFNIKNEMVKFNCRMFGIDSPEICPKKSDSDKIRELEIKAAVKSRNFLIEQITNLKFNNDSYDKSNKEIIKDFLAKSENLIWVHCLEFDKYGRLLVQLYKNPSDKISINQIMINNKYAIEYDGGTKTKFNLIN